MLETLTHEDFLPRVGQTFGAVTAEGARHELELVEVEVLEGPEDGQRRPFSLVFADTQPDRIEQQTVALSHDGMGDFPLFIVAIGGGPGGFRYQAVFT